MRTTKPAGGDLGAVEHVVFLMQENRSFDHYFGAYRGVRGFNDRSASALTAFHQSWPQGANGASVLLPFNLSSATTQLCSGNNAIPVHGWDDQHASWNNGNDNDRFVVIHSQEQNDGPTQAPLVMGYFTRQQLGYYYALADAFTICDNYFCSVLGPTMPNRLYFMSAFLDPKGTHGGPVLKTPGTLAESTEAIGSVRWDTMPEVLSDHGISWKVYQPPGTSVGPGIDLALYDGFNALLYFMQYVSRPRTDLYRRAFLPTWPVEFVADIRSGRLPHVSWILPPIAYSEHPNSSPAAGEWMTNQVLAALTENPEVWSKTVLFINYDENGGFFDHVVPPTPMPGTPGEEVSVSEAMVEADGYGGPIGLGFRVPMLVVSPWSRGGWVDSGTYDHTSTLRFLEARWGVPIPNLSAWRRQTVGDLTSTLGFGQSNTSIPALPATSLANLGNACPTPTNLGAYFSPPIEVTVPDPGKQELPQQEPGSPRRR